MIRFQHVAKSYYPPLSGLYSISAQNDYVSCPVDPGSIQGSHWPISLTRKCIPGIEYARTAYHAIWKFSKNGM